MAPRAVEPPYRRDRRRLVASLRAAGIEDLAVLQAFDAIPRHLFVPEAVRHRAYENVALPLGFGQAISRPGVHALHLSLAELAGSERVLEIGTGTGFQTALLAVLTAEVFTIEVVHELSAYARQRIEELGLANVHLRAGDGSSGWPEEAPFDVILVAAAAPGIPRPLVEQLAPGGRLLIPIGDHGAQRLLRLRLVDGELVEEEVESARFVPLIGEEGW